MKLSKEILGSLPSPDSQGLVRVKAALRVGDDGEVTIVELNGTPVPSGASDDENPMPAESLPDLGAMEADIYKG